MSEPSDRREEERPGKLSMSKQEIMRQFSATDRNITLLYFNLGGRLMMRFDALNVFELYEHLVREQFKSYMPRMLTDVPPDQRFDYIDDWYRWAKGRGG